MSLPSNEFAHLKIPLENILSATNNFAQQNFIGENGFEQRYKGQLLWSGQLIDIIARRLNKEWDGVEQLFWMEISMLSSLKHKNLVSFVGFCDEKIIIYRDETARGALIQYLSDPVLLTWVRRLEISVGVAHALSYIHYDESRDFSVIHRQIHSAAVLFNDDWEPKLSCFFERSMKIEASQRHHSFHTNIPIHVEGKAVINDDQDNNYLAAVAVTHYREKRLNEIIDWDIWNQIDSQSFNIFAETAYDCLNEERSQRPNIDEIVSRLEKALELQLEHQNAIMSSPSKEFAHLRVPLENILSATNNFAQQNFIGQNIIEQRYIGQLLWSGELIEIDVRRLNKDLENGEQQFWMEVSMLSSLKHKNVVSLVGFCDENDEKIIIIRREMKGSLSRYLSDPMVLTWVRRLEISVGIAHALSYIHYDEPRDFSVIHRHLCSACVLLNDEWEPKLSDFVCSMMIKASQRHHSFHTNKVKYVIGYGDPTYIETKSVNHMSDIYSFGIVLFELLCGRKSIIDSDSNKYLAPLAATHYKEKRLDEVIDWELWNQIDSQSLNMFAEIAYDCLNEDRLECPNIDEIVTRLEKVLELQLEHQNEIMSKEFAHLRVPLENILSATNNFSQQNVLGESGFAKAYKGQLLWSGELIKIDVRKWKKEWDGVEQQFWTEILMLSSLKHKNVVSLVGFCDDNDEKIIITKCETRGSLNRYLSDPMLLTWVRRLEISVGVAHALSYIHYEEPRDFSVIHRRIHSDIVLINDDWEPKLSDFQCSMKIKASQRHHSFHINTLVNVKGYGDPTYIETKSVNHKSDIYSFGIVLFELLCGRESVIDDQDNKYLGPMAIFHYKKEILDEIIDPILWKQMDPQSFNVFAKIAYDCLNEERSRRPDISEVVTRLENALKLQMRRQNVENSIVAAKVEDKSSDHHKGPLTSISTHVESHVTKKTKSFLKDLSHLKLSFQDIASATNNFAQENIIKELRFGLICNGRLWHTKLDIVAKGLYFAYIKDESKKFWTEISMLSSLKHKNLVSLIGFCDTERSKIIVYKKEANESLKKYLSDQTLTWIQRLKICVGVAKTLSYIHYDPGRDFSVIHCNVRSSKILLDDEWEPKLSGFELSLKNTVARRLRLLLTRDIIKNEYLDPKYEKTGGVTHKSDVYSFGVVLFEVLCGRSAVFPDEALGDGLLSQLAKSHLDDMMDPHLRKQMDPEAFKIFLDTAYWCIKEDRADRPYIDQVVKRLERALELQWKHENPVNRTPSIQLKVHN
ncbi:receptor-like tyrosine-protein kinase kin-15 [Artemisia annua]|uniref:Receptor-like tyrosine-protein kinase kin-15 n=1 Tax=Artemisia annua TaxID=35608 RepID=A0A2U1LRM8_ARTAN|nr:receptor-like tyrosine-protein kinase kin-15 [Artemisia annua]